MTQASEKFGFGHMRGLLCKAYEEPLPHAIESTLRLAVEGHHGQLRQSRSELQVPFIVHPVGVALLVIELYPLVREHVGDLESLVCIALAHDLIEDTRVGGREIEGVAGRRVRRMVEALTKPQGEAAQFTSTERTQLVLRQVCEAGPDALFVKACDLLHNLSRPDETPGKLYAKLQSKAVTYLPVIGSGDLGHEFAEVFAQRIDESTATNDQNGTRPRGRTGTLEHAIEECVRVARGKVVEIHDLSDILRHLLSADDCFVGDPGNRIQPSSRQSVSATVPGVRRAQLNLCVSYVDSPAPSWVTPLVLTGLLQILMQRVSLSEADRRAEMGLEASRYGLNIDIEAALKLGVTSNDLASLAEWRGRSEGAISIVSSALATYVNSPNTGLSMPGSVRIESRVKEASSIMAKFLSHSRLEWPVFRQIDDVAGVRLVVAVPRDLSVIDSFVESGGLAHHGVHCASRKDYYADPSSSGYRAIHFTLEVRLSESASVPCELQLRTMFQDAWAKVSHQAVYRADRKIRRRYSPQLKHMGRLLAECETTAQEIVVGED